MLHPLRLLLGRPLVRAAASLLLVLAVGAVFNADGAFFEWGTQRDMLRQVSVFGILACGMTVVIISGGIDLSVGSVLGLTAVVFSILSIHWHWSAPVAILVTLAVGTACGALSGGLVARFSMQPFIATLAMMVFARGAAKWISGGEKISTAVQLPDGSYTYVGVPPIFDSIGARIASGEVAVVTVLLVATLVLSWIILSHMPLGRALYAVGGNDEAARFSGIRTGTVRLLAYAFSGFCCALAGMCQAAQEQQGDPEAGSTYELTAIAMVVIGGTSLQGGSGSIWLTAVGILMMGSLEKILSINAVGEATRLVLTGVIIAVAVLLQSRGNR